MSIECNLRRYIELVDFLLHILPLKFESLMNMAIEMEISMNDQYISDKY